MKGLKLTPIGENIVRRGGDDLQSDDDMLFLELTKRAPGLSPEDHKRCFIALRVEFGEDALYAIRNGHVHFEEVPAGTRPEPTKTEGGES